MEIFAIGCTITVALALATSSADPIQSQAQQHAAWVLQPLTLERSVCFRKPIIYFVSNYLPRIENQQDSQSSGQRLREQYVLDVPFGVSQQVDVRPIMFRSSAATPLAVCPDLAVLNTSVAPNIKDSWGRHLTWIEGDGSYEQNAWSVMITAFDLMSRDDDWTALHLPILMMDLRGFSISCHNSESGSNQALMRRYLTATGNPYILILSNEEHASSDPNRAMRSIQSRSSDSVPDAIKKGILGVDCKQVNGYFDDYEWVTTEIPNEGFFDLNPQVFHITNYSVREEEVKRVLTLRSGPDLITIPFQTTHTKSKDCNALTPTPTINTIEDPTANDSEGRPVIWMSSRVSIELSLVALLKTAFKLMWCEGECKRNYDLQVLFLSVADAPPACFSPDSDEMNELFRAYRAAGRPYVVIFPDIIFPDTVASRKFQKWYTNFLFLGKAEQRLVGHVAENPFETYFTTHRSLKFLNWPQAVGQYMKWELYQVTLPSQQCSPEQRYFYVSEFSSSKIDGQNTMKVPFSATETVQLTPIVFKSTGPIEDPSSICSSANNLETTAVKGQHLTSIEGNGSYLENVMNVIIAALEVMARECDTCFYDMPTLIMDIDVSSNYSCDVPEELRSAYARAGKPYFLIIPRTNMAVTSDANTGELRKMATKLFDQMTGSIADSVHHQGESLSEVFNPNRDFWADIQRCRGFDSERDRWSMIFGDGAVGPCEDLLRNFIVTRSSGDDDASYEIMPIVFRSTGQSEECPSIGVLNTERREYPGGTSLWMSGVGSYEQNTMNLLMSALDDLAPRGEIFWTIDASPVTCLPSEQDKQIFLAKYEAAGRPKMVVDTELCGVVGTFFGTNLLGQINPVCESRTDDYSNSFEHFVEDFCGFRSTQFAVQPIDSRRRGHPRGDD